MAGRFGRARTKKVPSSRPTLTGWRRLYLFLTLYFFFIVRCLSSPAAMRCIIRKAQSVRWEELPVKASEELPLPIGLSQPTTKLASLSLPPSAALFAAAVGTPSNPNTPVREKKPETPKQSTNLKITLKRKRVRYREIPSPRRNAEK